MERSVALPRLRNSKKRGRKIVQGSHTPSSTEASQSDWRVGTRFDCEFRSLALRRLTAHTSRNRVHVLRVKLFNVRSRSLVDAPLHQRGQFLVLRKEDED